MTITPGYKSGPIYVGMTDDGMRVYIEIEYGHGLNAHITPVETTDHREIDRPSGLSITGYGTFSGRAASVMGGQITSTLLEVTRPAPGLERPDLLALVRIWDAWHLSDMTAACDHMDLDTVPADLPTYVPSYSATGPSRHKGDLDRTGWMLKHLVCPVTGYRYGRKWLAREVPAEILAELEGILGKRAARV